MKANKKLEYLIDSISDDEWNQIKLNVEQRKTFQKAEHVRDKIDTCESFGNYLLKNYIPTPDKKYWQNNNGDIFDSKELYFKYLNSISFDEEEE